MQRKHPYIPIGCFSSQITNGASPDGLLIIHYIYITFYLFRLAKYPMSITVTNETNMIVKKITSAMV